MVPYIRTGAIERETEEKIFEIHFEGKIDRNFPRIGSGWARGRTGLKTTARYLASAAACLGGSTYRCG